MYRKCFEFFSVFYFYEIILRIFIPFKVKQALLFLFLFLSHEQILKTENNKYNPMFFHKIFRMIRRKITRNIKKNWTYKTNRSNKRIKIHWYWFVYILVLFPYSKIPTTRNKLIYRRNGTFSNKDKWFPQKVFHINISIYFFFRLIHFHFCIFVRYLSNLLKRYIFENIFEAINKANVKDDGVVIIIIEVVVIIVTRILVVVFVESFRFITIRVGKEDGWKNLKRQWSRKFQAKWISIIFQ